jgi:hypothetical protein
MENDETILNKDAAAFSINKDMEVHMYLPKLEDEDSVPENVLTVIALASAFDARPDLIEPIIEWFIKETEQYDEKG